MRFDALLDVLLVLALLSGGLGAALLFQSLMRGHAEALREAARARREGGAAPASDDPAVLIQAALADPRRRSLAGALLSLVLAGTGILLSLDLAALVLLAAGGYFLPHILAARTRRRRARLLDEQFQPALLLLASSLKAGLSLPQAVEAVVPMVPQPLGAEFTALANEIRLGRPVADALLVLARTTALPDVRIAVDAMVISIRTGANLPMAFERIAETIRRRKTLQGKISAMTAQGKAQGAVAGAAPFVFAGIFYVIDPSYMGPLFTTLMGNLIILLVVVLQVAAFFAIRKITLIDV